MSDVINRWKKVRNELRWNGLDRIELVKAHVLKISGGYKVRIISQRTDAEGAIPELFPTLEKAKTAAEEWWRS